MESNDFNIVKPNQNINLSCTQNQEETLLNAWKNNKLSHSWIFSGIKGVGKATLAYKFAKFLLTADETKKDTYTSLEIDETNPILKLIEKNSCPNLLTIERDYIKTDKDKLAKMINKGDEITEETTDNLKKSAVIKVDEVRKINEFLSMTASNNNWRIVIIDSVDDMNRSSANSILKILEEPPAKTIIILISHNPSALLPTINSRCSKLHFNGLDNQTLDKLINKAIIDINEVDIKKLTNLARSSIGNALFLYKAEGLLIYDMLVEIFASLPKLDASALNELIKKSLTNDDSYNAFKFILLNLISQFTKNNNDLSDIASKLTPLVWSNIYNDIVKLLNDVDNLNMDRKSTIMNIFFNINKEII